MKSVSELNIDEFGYYPEESIIIDADRYVYIDENQTVSSMRNSSYTLFLQRAKDGYGLTLNRNKKYTINQTVENMAKPIKISLIFGQTDSRLPHNLIDTVYKTIYNFEGIGYVSKSAIKVTAFRKTYINLITRVEEATSDDYEIMVSVKGAVIQIAVPQWIRYNITDEDLDNSEQYLEIDKITGAGSLMPLENIVELDHSKLNVDITKLRQLSHNDIGFIRAASTFMDKKGYLLLEADAEIKSEETFEYCIKVTKIDKTYNLVIPDDHIYEISDFCGMDVTVIYADSVNNDSEGKVPIKNRKIEDQFGTDIADIDSDESSNDDYRTSLFDKIPSDSDNDINIADFFVAKKVIEGDEKTVVESKIKILNSITKMAKRHNITIK
jgi:hypothetical protein